MSAQPKWKLDGRSSYGGHWIGSTRRMAIRLRDGFQCVYCLADATGSGSLYWWGRSAGRSTGLPLDHVVSRARGGGHESSNVVTCCKRCNELKGSRSLAQWLAARVAAGALTDVQAILITERVRTQLAAPVDMATARNLVKWLRAGGANDVV